MQLCLPHEPPRPPADDDVPDLPRRSEPSGGLKGYGPPPGKRAGRFVRSAQPRAWS